MVSIQLQIEILDSILDSILVSLGRFEQVSFGTELNEHLVEVVSWNIWLFDLIEEGISVENFSIEFFLDQRCILFLLFGITQGIFQLIDFLEPLVNNKELLATIIEDQRLELISRLDIWLSSLVDDVLP